MASKLTQLRKKADREMQKWGKRTYDKCEICGKPISCLHHFFPKSTSARLRYDKDNLIPICQGCHMRHHQAGDPTIHGTIIKKRGQKWYDKLNITRHEMIKVNIGYYQQVIEDYINNKTL